MKLHLKTEKLQPKIANRFIVRRKRRTKRVSDNSPDFLIVGLGNPGKKYSNTRHNIGAETIYELVDRYGVRLRKSKELAACAEVKTEGTHLVLAVPETFMNESGLAVGKLMHRHNISEPSKLIVIHDELDLPSGKIKIKIGGGLAGHNGLKSIENHIHTREFSRIRIGIGAVSEGRKGRDYVLSRPSKGEMQALAHSKSVVADAIEFIYAHGYPAAMNKFNA